LSHFIHGHGPERALVLHWMVRATGAFSSQLMRPLDGISFSLHSWTLQGYGESKTRGVRMTSMTTRATPRSRDHLGWDTFNLGEDTPGRQGRHCGSLRNIQARVQRILANYPGMGRVEFVRRTNTHHVQGIAVHDVRKREDIIGKTTGGREQAVVGPKKYRGPGASGHADRKPSARYLESWANERLRIGILTGCPIAGHG